MYWVKFEREKDLERNRARTQRDSRDALGCTGKANGAFWSVDFLRSDNDSEARMHIKTKEAQGASFDLR